MPRSCEEAGMDHHERWQSWCYNTACRVGSTETDRAGWDLCQVNLVPGWSVPTPSPQVVVVSGGRLFPVRIGDPGCGYSAGAPSNYDWNACTDGNFNNFCHSCGSGDNGLELTFDRSSIFEIQVWNRNGFSNRLGGSTGKFELSYRGVGGSWTVCGLMAASAAMQGEPALPDLKYANADVNAACQALSQASGVTSTDRPRSAHAAVRQLKLARRPP